MSLNSIKDRTRSFASVFVKMGVFPIIFYLLLFLLLTYPAILHFSEWFWTGRGDGMLNVWSIWWVNKAVTELQESPWYTFYLHYPHGTSLLGHDLSPFNGFMGLILLRFMSLVQTFNFLVAFSFVLAGLTAFWLAYYFAKSYWGSLIAGYIYTFSNYHFAHAHGHLSLVALEWIPLFLLSWYLLLHKPRLTLAITSALLLFAVLLSNYYYFLASVLAAALVLGWFAWQKRELLFFTKKPYLASVAGFLMVVAITSGPLILSLILLNIQDPLRRGHDPVLNSLDALALFIPGGHWRFSSLTKSYWSQLPGFRNETSVYLGVSVIFLLAYAWLKRRSLQAEISLWYLLLGFFTVMALGPVLQVWGKPISPPILPYALLERLFPPLGVSGVPIRMVVMTTLSAAIIAGIGFQHLFRGGTAQKALASALLVILFVDLLPSPLPSTNIAPPGFVQALEGLPEGGIVDTISPAGLKLFYQTIHQKPMAFGYISRIPTSVWNQDQELRRLIAGQEYLALCQDYGIRYLVADPATKLNLEYPWIRLVYQDQEVKLYDLGAEKGCSLAG